MLLPEDYDNFAMDITILFSDLEEYVIRSMAKGLTPTTVHQRYQAGTLGIDIELRQTEAKVIRKTEEMLQKSNELSFERERVAFKLIGKTLLMTANKKNLIEQSLISAKGEILSLTGSLGMAGQPLERIYQKSLNDLYLQTITGISDYNSAIKRQLTKLTDFGLEVIGYSSGRRDRADVVLRRALITSMKNTTNRISELNALEMECDGYEVSAHIGARPSHAEWQGKQYAISDQNLGYPLYEDVVGFGMEEINCRHSKWGIFLGITTLAPKQEEPEPFIFSVDGREYNSYESTQKQRAIERAMRKTKRNIFAFNDDVDKSKLRQQRNLYRLFSKEAGLNLQLERAGI